MHPFQDNLKLWLSRRLPDRLQHQCIEIPFILSSDKGLVREENQDRVAALYTGKKSSNPLFAIAVADGMGGMRDGGECATLALSSFFYALVHYRNLNIYERASEAIKLANEEVFKIYDGNGGSTLTAVLIDTSHRMLFVHIGDTRIYTYELNGKIERHTTDDSLAEAVGGSGRELLQFVGMGDSMTPKIADLPNHHTFCAITTDGIHNLEEKTLKKILENSSDIKLASDRLSAVSRWCGGHDNSTSAIFNIKKIPEALSIYEGSGIRAWDAYGELTTLWLREEDQGLNPKDPRKPINKDKKIDPSNKSLTAKAMADENKSKRKRVKKEKQETGYKNIELDIQIGDPNSQGENDVDSK